MRPGLRYIRSLVVATLLLSAFIAPVAWMALTSMKTSRQIAARPGEVAPTEVVVDLEGTITPVAVLAEVAGPAVLVRDPDSGVRALVPAAVWAERPPDLPGVSPPEVLMHVDGPAAAHALVQPIGADADASLVIDADRVDRRLSVRWQNYPEAMREMGDFGRYLGNTLFVCLMQILGQLIAASIAAYGFGILEWRGRDKLFAVLLATMMIPFPVLMIPLFDLFRGLGWLGTLRPLWVPALFASAFNVFLMRQFFLGLPRSMFEAARLEGCSELRILWSIVLPVSKPVITTLVLFQFLFAWNDFLGPLIFLTDKSDYTISLALQFFQSQHGGVDWNLLMAASVITAAPIAMIFLAAQRFLVGGATMGSAK